MYVEKLQKSKIPFHVHIHNWLLKKIVGKKPFIANVTIERGIMPDEWHFDAGPYMYAHHCVFGMGIHIGNVEKDKPVIDFQER